MRLLIVVVVVVVALCGSATAGIDRMARRGELHLIVTEAGVSRCERFVVQPGAKAGVVSLSRGGDTITLAVSATTIALAGRSSSETGGGWSTQCANEPLAVTELATGLDVGGARWFDAESDCAAALAAKARVATDLSTCSGPADVTLQAAAASQRAFEAILRDGGSTYAIVDDACMPVHATPSKPRRRARSRAPLRGFLWHRVVEGGVRGKSGYAYELVPDAMTITLLGPSTEMEDGMSSGYGCGGSEPLSYGANAVELAQTHYLTRGACRRALAAERERRSRLPAEAEAGGVAAGAGVPAIGGC